ncbi:MAG: hypothetical protein A3B44_04275 [Candidatus Levybacteria bacterium RIFCSPLOWO2_01_FULL_38_21]|nr:MAG: hypothetical protein A3B44_04275 [Candidatus Levybacteria bacterium RIFCSPLOWO2_01_FULL_38_21]
MKLINLCNKVIEFSFYAIFLLIPLAIWANTSELFEFNKMWLAFGLGIIIAVSWIIKSIVKKELRIQKTPLDIPILLFLASQFLSTIFSWDRHISFWGYYSRFNGGLLSIILYIFLYYAFVTNFLNKDDGIFKSPLGVVKRFLNLSIITGVIVSLWGLPSHFGYDPTCLVFRGNLDVSCWAADFQPRVRIFSTLGQPDWLAAYLSILLPVSIAFLLENFKFDPKRIFKINRLGIFYSISSILFYTDLLYARSRSAILATGIAFIFLLFAYFYIKKVKFKVLNFTIPVVIFLLITFMVGLPFTIFNKFSYQEVKSRLSPPPSKTQVKAEKPAPAHTGELGGTDSGKIRLLVWRGAIEAFRNNPLFGTGVETFAFAYYRYKIPAHNLTSEWNFLYNKAHNEFLNYLATTGTFGITTYLLMIGWFLYLSLKKILTLIRKKEQENFFLILSLLASYITILITNFFGFSVVIVNIYLFMIPIFVFVLENMINQEKQLFVFKDKTSGSEPLANSRLSPFQWMGAIITVVVGFYFLFTLISYWNADKAYAYGYNLDRVGLYQDAYAYLHKAVLKRGDEPVFRDEMAINDAALASQLLSQKDVQNASTAAQTASTLSKEAISTSNDLVSSYPNNFVFWKTRIRIFYTLSQADPRLLPLALEAVRKAAELSPSDASIIYNLGVIEGQNGNVDKAIEVLERAVKLKMDYHDAHYALGLFYNQKAVDKSGNVISREFLNKAIRQMKYILTYINSSDTRAKEALKTFEKK